MSGKIIFINAEVENKEAFPAVSTYVTAHHPDRAVRVPQNTVRASPSAVFCSTTFCQPWSCCASPYPGWQNVSYLERYVQVWLRFKNHIDNKLIKMLNNNSKE